MKPILLVGDSWPHGEIDSNDNIHHGGIKQYFEDYGYNVYNLSFPGGSNLQSCKRLENFLNSNPQVTEQKPYVFFFVTEFFRELYNSRPFRKDQNEVNNQIKQGYEVVKSVWSNKPYYELSKIGQKWQLEIYVIGGCSDTVYLPDKINNVTITCQSWTNLLLTGNHLINNPVLTEFINGWVDPFLDAIKPYCSNRDLELLTADIELGNSRIESFYQNKKYFGPDPIHPNRIGHKVLFEFIVK